MRPSLLLCLAGASLPVPWARADYQEDTGFKRLQAELGAAIPDGTGVSVTQVEAALPNPPFGVNAYIPQAAASDASFTATGLFDGKTFNPKSGAGAASFHAVEVGSLFYGIDTALGNNPPSMSPGIVDVNFWEANSYMNTVLSPSGLEPVAETRAAQCHPWIYDSANSSQAPTVRDYVRRMDYAINRDNFVSVVGLNNGPTSVVPDMWASGYNVISAGLTNGEHSRGGVTSDMDGPARRKPEIVAPLTATSHAAGYIAGAAALLRQKADQIGTVNARKNRTIKAVLLAGATKEEFPAWSRTATDPIDAIYGAGELNIYNSYMILNGGEQPAGQTTGRPFMAWDYNSMSGNGSTEYRINIPAGQYGAELSAFIVWHRTPTDTNPQAGVFALGNDTLINFDLTLLRYPSAGGAATTIDTSTSTLYNLEHVWKKNLPAGNYSLRVGRGSGISHDYAIAWRVTVLPHQPQAVLTTSGNNYVFTWSDLLAGQPYKFQSSTDMSTWTDIESFTPASASASRTVAKTAAPRLYYRLLPVLP